jgi:hypothetical protein
VRIQPRSLHRNPIPHLVLVLPCIRGVRRHDLAREQVVYETSFGRSASSLTYDGVRYNRTARAHFITFAGPCTDYSLKIQYLCNSIELRFTGTYQGDPAHSKQVKRETPAAAPQLPSRAPWSGQGPLLEISQRLGQVFSCLKIKKGRSWPAFCHIFMLG